MVNQLSRLSVSHTPHCQRCPPTPLAILNAASEAERAARSTRYVLDHTGPAIQPPAKPVDHRGCILTAALHCTLPGIVNDAAAVPLLGLSELG